MWKVTLHMLLGGCLRWRVVLGDFNFISMRFKGLSSAIRFSFSHVRRSADGMADSLAKQGVHRVIPIVVCVCWYKAFVPIPSFFFALCCHVLLFFP